MIISREEPAVYKKCREVFGVGEWEKGIVIAYGDTVHCFNDLSKRPDIYVHEQVHLDQQKEIGVKVWWDRYFVDPKFRLDQEVPAYKAQLAYMREHYSRDLRKHLTKCICRDMVILYGDMCSSEEEALRLITT